MTRRGSTFGDEDWLAPDETGPSPWLRLARPLGLSLPVMVIVASVLGQPPLPPIQIPSAALIAGAPTHDQSLLWFDTGPLDDALAIHLEAFDWRGLPHGTLALPCNGPCSYLPSPDGQRLLVYQQPAKGQTSIPGIVYDVHAQPVGTVADPPATWADDSRHLCKLRPTAQLTPNGPSEAQLEFIDSAGGAERLVASVGGVNSAGIASFWDVLACSVTTDRAVVVFRDSTALHNVRVVQLSSGRMLYGRDDLIPGASCGCPVADMEVSANAAVAAENLGDGLVQLRDLSTGAVTPWPPSKHSSTAGPFVLSLSWRGRLALTLVGVIEVSSGRWLWRGNVTRGTGSFRPGTDDILLYEFGRQRLVIVQADGASHVLPMTEGS